MMAFFLLLWLISSASDETKKGLADFFSNATVNIGPPGGVGGVLDGMTVTPSSVPPLPTSPFDRPPELPNRPEDEEAPEPGIPSGDAAAGEAARGTDGRRRAEREQAGFDRAKAAILAALQVEPELRGFKDSLLIEEAPEGLRVADPGPRAAADVPGRQRRHVPAHAAAAAAGGRGDRRARPTGSRCAGTPIPCRSPRAPAGDNWHLSADRANATRAGDDRGRARPGPGGRGGRRGRRRAAGRRSARPIRATGGSRWCSCVQAARARTALAAHGGECPAGG